MALLGLVHAVFPIVTRRDDISPRIICLMTLCSCSCMCARMCAHACMSGCSSSDQFPDFPGLSRFEMFCPYLSVHFQARSFWFRPRELCSASSQEPLSRKW